MPTVSRTDWRKEFEIEGRRPPQFFAGPNDIDKADAATTQAHVLRRAFEELELSGVLGQDGTAVVYFREVARIVAAEVAALQRTFWNQGVAPILVLIAPDEVHVYSGLAQPTVARQLKNALCRFRGTGGPGSTIPLPQLDSTPENHHVPRRSYPHRFLLGRR